MKISELKAVLDKSLAAWGDLECYIDIDPNEEDIYSLDYIFCDISPDHPDEQKSLVFAAYGVEPNLKLVKS